MLQISCNKQTSYTSYILIYALLIWGNFCIFLQKCEMKLTYTQHSFSCHRMCHRIIVLFCRILWHESFFDSLIFMSWQFSFHLPFWRKTYWIKTERHIYIKPLQKHIFQIPNQIYLFWISSFDNLTLPFNKECSNISLSNTLNYLFIFTFVDTHKPKAIICLSNCQEFEWSRN